jgi:diacylglycerol O-acyltransferase / wax synthase
MTTIPRRALIVSATIGEGHNSAGRALKEAIERTWPGCEVGWLDTLSAIGPGFGPLARAWYVSQIRYLPWMYEYFFAATGRRRRSFRPARRLIGSWCGRRMAGRIRDFSPDLIISTYPLGSAGLSWLRQHRGLDVPAGAWVPAFWPHPYWLYQNLDITYVMHPAALPVAASAEPGIRLAVGALPVREAFAPGDRTAARLRLGLRPDRFVAAVCSGSLGFGSADDAVSALLAAGPQVQVVAICGHNQRLRDRLRSRGEPPDRLLVTGWTDDMPSWIRASDVVVGNAGGATALEALACGVPLIMFEPIAGHGRANAALMTSAGLALSPGSPAGLTETVTRLATDPAARAELDRAARAGRGTRQPQQDLTDLASMPGRGPAPLLPVRSGDALFAHVHSPTVPQQVGAVVLLNGPRPGLPGLHASVAAAAGQIPHLRRRLQPGTGPWRKDRWIVEDRIDVRPRISEMTLGAAGTPASLDEIVGGFFARAVDPGSAAWQMLLVNGLPPAGNADSAVVVKVHHALGDSYALVSLLAGMLDPGSGPAVPRNERPAAAADAGRRSMRSLPGRTRRVASGLAGIAIAGRTRPAAINGTSTNRREFAAVSLDSRAVTITARRLGATQADLVLALTAEALGQHLTARGESADRKVRVMVPRTLRTAGQALRGNPPGPGGAVPDPDHLPTNRTAGLLLDVPVGPMSLGKRAASIRAAREAQLSRGDADATAFVVSAMNLLPAPLQRGFARRVYASRHFNVIVSVFPGLRRNSHLLGAEIQTVFPVLALADGVGLAVGAMAWGQSMSIGLLADPALTPDVAVLAEDITKAFAAGQRLAREHGAGEHGAGEHGAGEHTAGEHTAGTGGPAQAAR